jgi:hypothetical protein
MLFKMLLTLNRLKSGFSPHDARAKYCTQHTLWALIIRREEFALIKLEFSHLVKQKKY